MSADGRQRGGKFLAEIAPEIFEQDPFLLKPESQEAYGRMILKNVLTGRTFNKRIVEDIDLHSAETAKGRASAQGLPKAPPKELSAKYLRHRKERESLQLSGAEFKDLAAVTMVADVELTLGRLPREGARQIESNVAAAAELEDAKVRSTFSQRLRIAAVGFRVKISKLREDGYLEEDLCALHDLKDDAITGLPDCRELSQLGRTTMRTKDVDRWSPTICSHIKKAIDSGSHIVVLPEFALPPSRDGFDIERQIRECGMHTTDDKQDYFIFAGSRHEGGYNRGLVIHKKGNKLSNTGHWHYKIAPARSLGENVLGPRSHALHAYPVTVPLNGTDVEISILIAICYDSFDPSTFLRLVLLSAKQEHDGKERIILVPSFNPNPIFVEMLRDLSFLTKCPVLYVNGLHGDARMFVSGIAVRDILKETGPTLLNRLNAQLAAIKKEFDDLPRSGQDTDGVQAQLRTRIGALEIFVDRIEGLQNDGALDHLISVEPCQHCSDGSHVDDYECATDILYYNIDYELIRTLIMFRREYFGKDEVFLPEPLRSGQLRALAREMGQSEKAMRLEA